MFRSLLLLSLKIKACIVVIFVLSWYYVVKFSALAMVHIFRLNFFFFWGGVINMAIYWTCIFTHSNCFVSYIITILTCNNVKCSILKIVLFSEQLSKKLIKHRLPSPIIFLSCIIFCKLVICYPIISYVIEKKRSKS